MRRGSKTWYGACQVDTRCFLLLLGFCLLFCELDRRRRGNSSCSIRIRQARLSVWVWKTIWVWQGLRLLRLLRAHGSYGCWTVRLRLLRPVAADRMKRTRKKKLTTVVTCKRRQCTAVTLVLMSAGLVNAAGADSQKESAFQCYPTLKHYPGRAASRECARGLTAIGPDRVIRLLS